MTRASPALTVSSSSDSPLAARVRVREIGVTVAVAVAPVVALPALGLRGGESDHGHHGRASGDGAHLPVAEPRAARPAAEGAAAGSDEALTREGSGPPTWWDWVASAMNFPPYGGQVDYAASRWATASSSWLMGLT